MADIALNFQPELAEIGLAAFADPDDCAECSIAALKCLAEQSAPVECRDGQVVADPIVASCARNPRVARSGRSHRFFQVNTDQ